jgi:hypothetical protein
MPNKKTSKNEVRTETDLALTPLGLRELLPISKRGSYALAKQIGRRIGCRYIVSRLALNQWLDGTLPVPSAAAEKTTASATTNP